MKKTLLFLSALLAVSVLKADEGMWLPDSTHAALRDAVVMFGNGCTGEVVSAQGLILTNHHCGYGSIQAHSTLEHDYLTDGFWAASLQDELPCKGLQVRFLRRINEVTDLMLEGLDISISESVRQDSLKARAGRLTSPYTGGMEGRVVPFYCGNRYYLFVYEVFSDIRLVGAPPSNIGKFGGDSDNWMFPRHTGDFSVFRIYADSLNRPAAYSAHNKPYTPERFFKINLKGYDEGDFTMVMGYPGSTQEYISSYAVENVQRYEDPMRIAARDIRIGIIKAAMERDAQVRIQYASKVAGIANGWKKWQGEVRGLQKLNAVGGKKDYEQVFTQWCNTAAGAAYAGVLPALEKAYEAYRLPQEAMIRFTEYTLAAEAVSLAYAFKNLCELSAKKAPEEEIAQALNKVKSRCESVYKNYNTEVDCSLFLKMTPEENRALFGKTAPEEAFRKSLFTHPDRMTAFLEKYTASGYKTLEKDPLYRYACGVYENYYAQVLPAVKSILGTIDSLQRLYMKGQMELRAEAGGKAMYPDANFTMRVTTGRVAGFKPADAVNYKAYSTVEGIMQKENPDVYDYVVEPRLKELYATKDYGRYANLLGEMPVAFIGTNHTTGGNSGSPVLNAEGHLIGINFDRNWEGTMSDICYSPDLCRNIMLDIRYCLFIIDKFAGATRLIEEMEIVE